MLAYSDQYSKLEFEVIRNEDGRGGGLGLLHGIGDVGEDGTVKVD